MFVFGGCTSTSSTFNDLWELSLSLRTWARPLSVGAYPSPKACATLVLHRNCLVLFGGWTHPSLYPLHQSWKLFSELHIYHLQESRWELVGPEEGARPPAMAGHSATVHGDTMVVFGGLHKQPSQGHYTSSNDVWTLDLASQRWQLQLTGGEARPLPRYGQSQVVAGPGHLLLLGGCGGPNTEYADIWLLDMTAQPWTWAEMEVRGEEHRAKDIWSHPACRVGDLVVVLGKGRREEPVPGPADQARQPAQARRGPLRRAAAPAPHRRHDFSSSDSDLELAVEPVPPRGAPSYRTTLSVNIGPPPGPSPPPPSALPPSNPASAPNALIPVKVTPAHAKAFGPGANTGNQDPSLTSSR
jgi:F-box protein 42